MESRHERYAINKFCEFKDREVESDFMEYEKTTSLGIVRILILIMGFSFALFVISDYYYYGKESGFYFSLALRCAALIITIVSSFFAVSFKRYDRTLILITLTELAVFIIYLLNLYASIFSASGRQAGEPAITNFMSVLILILAVFLIPNRWKNCIFAGIFIITSYLIFCSVFLSHVDLPSVLQQGLYLGICLVSCAIFIYGRENSERKHFAAEKLLELMTITDWLTGIYNRRRFEYILNLWIKNKRHDPFCLLFFDIDDFKIVNDTYGHKAGDEVLVKTTSVVSSKIRDDDIFARWGGEEFVVLFSGISIDMGRELAERLRKAVENNPLSEAEKVTISIGVVQYRRGENNVGNESIEDFVARADEKMYDAKRAGKNMVKAEE
jgi:two-component system, cell cycle response regulator